MKVLAFANKRFTILLKEKTAAASLILTDES